MDIVLEVLDTFVGDHVYAALHPAKSLLSDFDPASNATTEPLSAWRYEPATAYLHLEPSKAAYMSAWSRDNIYRQTLSLFLITWYAQLPYNTQRCPSIVVLYMLLSWQLRLTSPQDLRVPRLLHIRRTIVRLRFRQENDDAPQILEEPSMA